MFQNLRAGSSFFKTPSLTRFEFVVLVKTDVEIDYFLCIISSCFKLSTKEKKSYKQKKKKEEKTHNCSNKNHCIYLNWILATHSKKKKACNIYNSWRANFLNNISNSRAKFANKSNRSEHWNWSLPVSKNFHTFQS